MKVFPKQFVHETGNSENEHYGTGNRTNSDGGGEMELRTCPDGRVQLQKMFDNSWVVPSYSLLSTRFSCRTHADLWIFRTGGITLFFKYICNFHGSVTMGAIR